MKWLSEELQKLDPQELEGEPDERLVEALSKSINLVKTFDSVANAISAMDATEAAHTLFKGFEYILTLYYLPIGFSGRSYNYDQDFYKFIGHEIFVIFIAYLIKDGRWSLIDEVLKNNIHIENSPSGRRDDTLSFTLLVAYLSLLDEIRSKRLEANNQRRTSIHADLLKERHESMPLSENLTWHEFMDADHFLFFYTMANSASDRNTWWPRTYVYFGSRIPRFIIESYSPKGVKDLTAGLGLKNTKDLKPAIQNAVERYQKGISNTPSGFIMDPFRGFDINKIPES